MMAWGAGMDLGDVIEALEARHPGSPLPFGIKNPHSYRGYYEDVAFERTDEPATVSDWLTVLRSAIGNTYEGWKGGDYTMDAHSEAWLAEPGATGDPFSPLLIELLTSASPEVPR